MKLFILKARKPLLLVVVGVVLVLMFVAISKIRRLPDSREQIVGAAMTGDLDRLKKLEAKGVSLDVQNPLDFGWSPLIAAVFHQETNVIEYLLAKNVKMNLKDNNGRTALMWAISFVDTNTVRMLLEKGADVSVTDAVSSETGGADAFGYVKSNEHREILLEWLNKYKKAGKTN